MDFKNMASRLKARYGMDFYDGYLRYALMFSEADRGKPSLQTHHVCPRCCGGKDDDFNLIRITFEHHRTLHRLILLTESLTPEQRRHLQFAYSKMRGK